MESQGFEEKKEILGDEGTLWEGDGIDEREIKGKYLFLVVS